MECTLPWGYRKTFHRVNKRLRVLRGSISISSYFIFPKIDLPENTLAVEEWSWFSLFHFPFSQQSFLHFTIEKHLLPFLNLTRCTALQCKILRAPERQFPNTAVNDVETNYSNKWMGIGSFCNLDGFQWNWRRTQWSCQLINHEK